VAGRSTIGVTVTDDRGNYPEWKPTDWASILPPGTPVPGRLYDPETGEDVTEQWHADLIAKKKPRAKRSRRR
jgi:hypothetical protein